MESILQSHNRQPHNPKGDDNLLLIHTRKLSRRIKSEFKKQYSDAIFFKIPQVCTDAELNPYLNSRGQFCTGNKLLYAKYDSLPVPEANLHSIYYLPKQTELLYPPNDREIRFLLDPCMEHDILSIKWFLNEYRPNTELSQYSYHEYYDYVFNGKRYSVNPDTYNCQDVYNHFIRFKQETYFQPLEKPEACNVVCLMQPTNTSGLLNIQYQMLLEKLPKGRLHTFQMESYDMEINGFLTDSLYKQDGYETCNLKEYIEQLVGNYKTGQYCNLYYYQKTNDITLYLGMA